MCDMTEGCDGRLDQTNRCETCGEDALDYDPATFSGGAGSRSQPLSDDDYRAEMEKLGRR